MSNINNFYFNNLDLRLSNSEYWDFYLSSDEQCLTMYDDIISGSCLVAHFDFNESGIFTTGTTSADTIYSLTTWEDAINNGVSGVTWGFTGIDNGQISFDIPSIGNTSLLSGLTASTLVIPSGDTRLCLNRVTGHTVDEIEFVYNGDFTNGLSGWIAQGWNVTTGDTIQTIQVVTPPNILTSDIVQIFNTPLIGGKKYLYTIDILSLEGQIICGDNIITEIGRETFILDLTSSIVPTSALTITLSGYTRISAEIDKVSIIGYEPTIIYPIEQIVDTGMTGNYARMCGGFYQGYYKLDGEDYEVLPNRMPKAWTTEFILRKSDLNCTGATGTTLNDLYPDNKGIFFYLGTRAENKFWNIFNGNNTGCTSACTSDTGCTTGSVTTYCTKIKETDVYYLDDETGFMLPLSPPAIDITKIDNQFLLYGRAGNRQCNKCGELSDPDGLGTYHACDDISNVYITGYSQTVVNTDNKFLTFCRSCRPTCNDCNSSNCSSVTGGTCTTVCEYTGDTVINDSLDPLLDIYDNALGFRIKDDGSIGYKSLIFTGYCSGDTYITGVTVQEEYSVSGMVTDDEWTKISIRFVLNETYDECQLKSGPRRKGKLMFYVNCRLKFVSKEIDEFIARRLIEQDEKQLTVPFNISIGGGTQGLLESMTFDGQDSEDLGMVVEENYAGSFIGDISQFRFYMCDLSWCDIKNNCFFEDNRYY